LTFVVAGLPQQNLGYQQQASESARRRKLQKDKPPKSVARGVALGVISNFFQRAVLAGFPS
jgi:uncharacterized protein (DUF2062 family)